jgi:hypothetical protein
MAEFNQTHQRVIAQYNADTINLFVDAQRAIRRRQWRDIEILYYPVLEFADRWAERLGQDIAFALDHAYTAQGEFRRFNAIFYQTEGPTKAIAIFCHQVRFVSALRRRARERVLKMMELRELTQDQIILEGDKYNKDWKEKWKDWDLSIKIECLKFPSASEIVFDPETNLIRVKPLDPIGLDPAEYVEHLSTTSELLHFVSSMFHIIQQGGSPEIHLGNYGWIKDNFSLLKLLVALTDNEFRLKAIRVDAADLESWDFSNPIFEEEIISV